MLFCGTHLRHRFVARRLATVFQLCGVVWEEREAMVPQAPAGLPNRDRHNFERHFREREAVERAQFGSGEALETGTPALTVGSRDLNARIVSEFVAAHRPDFVVVFGTGIIKGDLLASLPRWSVNLHLGLSPWYRGSATLFWPFFNLEPQQTGATLHLLTDVVDAGSIVAQCTPALERGDGIHDVAAKCVHAVADDCIRMLQQFEREGTLPVRPQKTSGRLYLGSDFHPSHLRVIYDLFDNRIVDAYLDGELGSRRPRLT